MDKKSIIILVISILFASGAFIFIKPIMAEISKLEADALSLENSKAGLIRTKKDLENKTTVKKNANMEKISETLPADPGIPDLLVQIQAISAKSGVAMDSFSFSLSNEGQKSLLSASDSVLKGEDKGEIFPSVGISMEVTGVYSSIKSFIKNIENNIRIMDINSIKISGPSTKESLEMKASVEISAYYNPSLAADEEKESNLNNIEEEL